MLTWERRLAKKYYDKLFKEYAIADLSRYEDGAIGLRWRTEREVVSGKGQFSCGAKRCEQFNDLESYEVDFSYREAGEKKQALVKLRVCKACAARLNYRHARKKARRQAKEKRREAKRQRVASPPPSASASASASVSAAAAASAASAASSAASSSSAAAAVEELGFSVGAAVPSRSASPANEQSTASSPRDARVSAPPADAKATVEPSGSTENTETALAPVSDTVWSRPALTEKTIGDEFDEYFDDLLQ